MRLAIDGPQTCRRDMRVDLGRREALVAEQLLHDAQIGAAIEQVRRERMAERVRRTPSGRPAMRLSRSRRARRPRTPRAPPSRFRNSSVGSRPGASSGRRRASSGRPSARYVSIASRAGRPSRPIRSFRPLPSHPQLPASQLERAQVGRGELADPETRGVGGLDERPVAERERRRKAFVRGRPDVGVDGTEEPLDLVDLEDPRQPSWQAWRGDRAPRVARRETLARGVAMERADRREPLGDRAARVPVGQRRRGRRGAPIVPAPSNRRRGRRAR